MPLSGPRLCRDGPTHRPVDRSRSARAGTQEVYHGSPFAAGRLPRFDPLPTGIGVRPTCALGSGSGPRFLARWQQGSHRLRKDRRKSVSPDIAPTVSSQNPHLPRQRVLGSGTPVARPQWHRCVDLLRGAAGNPESSLPEKDRALIRLGCAGRNPFAGKLQRRPALNGAVQLSVTK